MYEGFIRINKLSIVKHNKLLIFWDSYIFLQINAGTIFLLIWGCLLYTSDAADDSLRVDLGGRRIIKKNYI